MNINPLIFLLETLDLETGGKISHKLARRLSTTEKDPKTGKNKVSRNSDVGWDARRMKMHGNFAAEWDQNKKSLQSGKGINGWLNRKIYKSEIEKSEADKNNNIRIGQTLKSKHNKS